MVLLFLLNLHSIVLFQAVVQNQIAEATTKVGQPKLAIKRIEDFLVALPPVAELDLATQILCTSVKLAAIEKLVG